MAFTVSAARQEPREWAVAPAARAYYAPASATAAPPAVADASQAPSLASRGVALLLTALTVAGATVGTVGRATVNSFVAGAASANGSANGAARSAPVANSASGAVGYLESLGSHVGSTVGSAVGQLVIRPSTTSTPTSPYSPSHSPVLPKRKQALSVMPCGPAWFDLSSDFGDASALPLALSSNPQAMALWGRIETHTSKGDVFHDHEGIVEALLQSGAVSRATKEQIERDLPRTFPDEELFNDTDVVESMRRILLATCVEHPGLGYVQSMNFLVAFLLLHCKTDDAAFCLFRRVLTHPRMQMEQMYVDGFPLLRRVVDALDALMELRHPDVHAHLAALNIQTMMWAQTNIMTLFTYGMDWVIVTPIWTEFIQVGWAAVLKVFLHLVAVSRTKLLAASDFESGVMVLRAACGSDAPRDLMSQANVLDFSLRDMVIVQRVYFVR